MVITCWNIHISILLDSIRQKKRKSIENRLPREENLEIVINLLMIFQVYSSDCNCCFDTCECERT